MSAKIEKILSILNAGSRESFRLHNEALEELIRKEQAESPQLSKESAALVTVARRMIKGAERAAAQIEALIKSAEDNTERELLALHYVQGMPWAHIAEQMGYSERQIYRLHNKAIDNLATHKRKGVCRSE